MQNVKPPYTMSISQVRPGHVIPDDLLLKLVTENRSFMGFAVREKSGIQIEKFGTEDMPMESIEADFKNMKNILHNTKQFSRMFCFGQCPEEFDEDEIQPFIIIKDSKGSPILCIAVEGDFPGRDVDQSSEPFGLVHEYLGPKIEKLYKLCGNDPKKLIEELKGKEFSDDLDNVIGHRGVFAFLPVEGDQFVLGKNDLNGSFPWGECSLTYGHKPEEPQAAAPSPAPTKRTSKYASSLEPAAPVEPEKPLPDGVHRVPDKSPPSPIEKVAAEVQTDMVNKQWLEPPKNLHGKKLKGWYRSVNGGVLPMKWNDRPKVLVSGKESVKSLTELDQLQGVKQEKTPSLTATAETIEQLPVMSGKQQAEVVGFIKKHIDANSRTMPDPLELQKIESKLLLFTEATGHDLDYFDNASPSLKFALAKQYPEAAALLLIQYGGDRRARKTLVLDGNKKLGELTGTAKSTTEVQSPTPSPEPETPSEKVHAPYKKSKYA